LTVIIVARLVSSFLIFVLIFCVAEERYFAL